MAKKRTRKLKKRLIRRMVVSLVSSLFIMATILSVLDSRGRPAKLQR